MIAGSLCDVGCAAHHDGLGEWNRVQASLRQHCDIMWQRLWSCGLQLYAAMLRSSEQLFQSMRSPGALCRVPAVLHQRCAIVCRRLQPRWQLHDAMRFDSQQLFPAMQNRLVRTTGISWRIGEKKRTIFNRLIKFNLFASVQSSSTCCAY